MDLSQTIFTVLSIKWNERERERGEREREYQRVTIISRSKERKNTSIYIGITFSNRIKNSVPVPVMETGFRHLYILYIPTGFFSPAIIITVKILSTALNFQNHGKVQK
jgi:hypothetical protein